MIVLKCRECGRENVFLPEHGPAYQIARLAAFMYGLDDCMTCVDCCKSIPCPCEVCDLKERHEGECHFVPCALMADHNGGCHSGRAQA